MAHILNSTFGKISGKIGDCVIRNINGKSFASRRPLNYKAPNDPQSVARRNKFGITTKFSSCLTKNPFLKELWLNYNDDGKGTAFNKITKHLYRYIADGDIGHDPKIYPGFSGLPVFLKNVSFTNDSLSVEINSIPEDEKQNYQCMQSGALLQMAAFIKSDDPYYEAREQSFFLNLSSENCNLTLSKPMSLSCKLNDMHNSYLSQYSRHRLFILFFVLDKDRKLICPTDSFDLSITKIPSRLSFK